MQPDTGSQHQQQIYQKKLLLQQQQQMSQNYMSPTTEPSTTLVQSPVSMTTSTHIGPVPLTATPRIGSAHMLNNSRMGPPSLLAQNGALGISNASSEPSPVSPYFGPGAGLARLHQYSEALREGPDRQTSEYWKSFADEFFLPQATLHLVLYNPSTREHKGFEVPSSVVARWMQTNYISGVLSSFISLESPREFLAGQPFPPPPRSIRADFHLPTANVTHFIDCKRSLLMSTYENGWQVQMMGLVRAAFVPHTRVITPSSISSDAAAAASKDGTSILETRLRLECLEVLITSHRSYFPSTSACVRSSEEYIPMNVVKDILAANGQRIMDEANRTESKVASDQDDSAQREATKSEFSIKVNHVQLPESPVNEYGITLRAMRCLEITESVCQLRDLMDYTTKDKERQLGAIEGLKKLTSQYREMGGQNPALAVGMPSNALHFDVDALAPSAAKEEHHTKGRRDNQFDGEVTTPAFSKPSNERSGAGSAAENTGSAEYGNRTQAMSGPNSQVLGSPTKRPK